MDVLKALAHKLVHDEDETLNGRERNGATDRELSRNICLQLLQFIDDTLIFFLYGFESRFGQTTWYGFLENFNVVAVTEFVITCGVLGRLSYTRILATLPGGCEKKDTPTPLSKHMGPTNTYED